VKHGGSTVYGPVPSRRFGLSLGLDLVPVKTCTFDCVYCQIGATTELTVDRRDFVPLATVLADLEEALRRGPQPEVVTLAGSGEPTLYRSLGELVRRVHALTDVPVLLLTNGSLFSWEDVARDALLVDLLAPSLDAGDERTFRRLNRPHPQISYDTLLAGLRDVTHRFPGPVHLEVMLVNGLNDDRASLEAIAARLPELRATTIDINTVVRPSGVPGARASTPETLELARTLFGEKARIIASFPSREASTARELLPDERRLLALIARRPCTIEDIEAALDLDRSAVVLTLDRLVRSGAAEKRVEGGGAYFRALRH
jgi:wyosine [tRNA(Phe)-imidazoG37] synthetase (radical SAM superfamily)